jgi:hypothetical protein
VELHDLDLYFPAFCFLLVLIVLDFT